MAAGRREKQAQVGSAKELKAALEERSGGCWRARVRAFERRLRGEDVELS
jgi:hypothetical protein